MFGFFSSGISLKTVIASLPAHYDRNDMWRLKPGSHVTLLVPSQLTVNIMDVGYWILSQVSQIEININDPVNWPGSAVDYSIPANRAGKDFYIYACKPYSGNAPVFILSDNPVVPAGHTYLNTRRIAGFHCLCADVGTISGHSLSGYIAGDILPASIWDMKHRPVSEPIGMVFSDKANIWVDIYLISGTKDSKFGGAIATNRNWHDFVKSAGGAKKRLLKDFEFQLIADGSNELTQINGKANPGTAGGHVDINGRRMISNIGCEDCCGLLEQWLDEQVYRYEYVTGHTHKENLDAEYTQNATTGGASPAVAMEWRYTPGGKGMTYQQGQNGHLKMTAGGGYDSPDLAPGTLSRNLIRTPGISTSVVGARFCAEKIIHSLTAFSI